MYKKDIKVDISKHIKNLIILPSGYVYYFTKSKYDPNLKYTVDDRIAIGKLVNPNEKTLMYPNNNYYKFFPENSALADPGKKDTELHIGAYFVLIASAKKSGCLEALKRVFPKDYKKILALAIFSIECQDSTIQHFDKWSFSNYSGIDCSLSLEQVSELYKKIDNDDINEFLNIYQNKYKTIFNNIDKTAIVYDSNSKNTIFQDISADNANPIINTLFLADETTGIPLYYNNFLGSLPDQVQITYTNKTLRDLGFNKLFYMLDSAYYSKNNIEDLENDTFGMMMPSHIDTVKQLLKQHIEDVRENEKNYSYSESIYGIKLSKDIFNKNKFYNIYIYYDLLKAFEERNFIHSKIDFYIENLNKIQYYSEKLEKIYGKYFDFTKTNPKANNSKFSFKYKIDEVQKEIDLAGMFCILSNEDIKADEMILKARIKDRGEKEFNRFITSLNLTTTYSHFDYTYKGKMFIAFIALVLCETYRYYIRRYINMAPTNTIFTSLAELSKIIICKTNNKYSQKYALTKNAKSILSGLDLDQNSLTKFIDKINTSIN